MIKKEEYYIDTGENSKFLIRSVFKKEYFTNNIFLAERL